MEAEHTEELPKRVLSPLRHLHDTRASIQKLRIGLGNRLSAISRGVDDIEDRIPPIYRQIEEVVKNLETRVDEAIEDELDKWPVYNLWLSQVKGIGPSMSGQMLSLLLPPIPEKGPSSWYKAAGLSPEVRRSCHEIVVKEPDDEYYHCPVHVENIVDVEGAECGLALEMRLPRARAGEGKITYHPHLRRCLYNVATGIVRTNGYYRKVYDQQKVTLTENHRGDKEWPPHRLDSVARWRMIRMFLAHLWEAWCEAEGIHNRGPYVVEKMNHQYIPRPLQVGRERI